MQTTPSRAGTFDAIADQVLSGQSLLREQACGILSCRDDQLLELLDATWRVRRHHFGNRVQLYLLKNARSGLCPEDCHYCSQSAISEAAIERYSMLSEQRLLEGARDAFERRARTYCIVASGRGPSHREVEHVAGAVRRIKELYGLHICCCLGILSSEQAQQLKDAGVDRINHNLNTSRRFHEQICSTHTFDDRMNTLAIARDAGLELCAGLIVGMGEEHDDVIDVAFQLHELGVESIPVNFLNPIDGTPLKGRRDLNPRYCLKVLSLFRLCNPGTEIRIAGGREVNLRSLQPMDAGHGTVRRQFDVRQRLSNHAGPAGRRRFQDDRGPWIRNRGPVLPAGE